MSNKGLTELKSKHNRQLMELMKRMTQGWRPDCHSSTNNGADDERRHLMDQVLDHLKASVENIDKSLMATNLRKDGELASLRLQVSNLNRKIEEIERAMDVMREKAEMEELRSVKLEKRAQFLAQKAAENFQQAERIAELDRQLAVKLLEIEHLQQRLEDSTSLAVAKDYSDLPGQLSEREEIKQLSPRANEIYWQLKAAIVRHGGLG